jgi:hypothetical protein
MKKKQRPEKRRTDEERSRLADNRLKRYIANSAIELAKREPDVQREMVAQTFGYHIPDQTERARNELDAYIDNLAIKMLKENSGFARTVAEARVRKVTEEMGLNLEGGQRKSLPLDDYINLANKYKELKGALGIKEPGVWSSLLDPKVISSILALVSQVLTKEQPPAENKVLVLVKMDGLNRLIPKEDYSKITGKEPVAYLDGEEPLEPDNEAKSNDPSSEPESPDKTASEDGETGATNPGD